jgi:hypothetical protein
LHSSRYYSDDELEEDETGRTWEGREMYTGLFSGQSEVKWPFGRPRHKWEYDIRIDSKETDWRGGGGSNSSSSE